LLQIRLRDRIHHDRSLNLCRQCRRITHDLFKENGVSIRCGDWAHSAAPDIATTEHDERITASIRKRNAQEIAQSTEGHGQSNECSASLRAQCIAVVTEHDTAAQNDGDRHIADQRQHHQYDLAADKGGERLICLGKDDLMRSVNEETKQCAQREDEKGDGGEYSAVRDDGQWDYRYSNGNWNQRQDGNIEYRRSFGQTKRARFEERGHSNEQSNDQHVVLEKIKSHSQCVEPLETRDVQWRVIDRGVESGRHEIERRQPIGSHEGDGTPINRDTQRPVHGTAHHDGLEDDIRFDCKDNPIDHRHNHSCRNE